MQIHPDVPDGLLADQGRLRQLVMNLVGNAIKFTSAGEVLVEVSLASATEDAVVLHFAVRDTGVGIPPDKIDRVFLAFEQADASITRKFGGTGLGLAISQRLVELMHGRLWVESTPGAGSTFHFTVRAQLADLPLGPRPGRGREQLRNLRVLVVDDNRTNRVVLDEILRSWEMRCTTAADGQEALDLVHAAHRAGDPFALVITDAHMPEMDGFTLAERLKPDRDLHGAVVVMLSSGDRADDLERYAQAGIAAHLMKPVKQSELFDAIAALSGVRTPHESAAADDAASPGGARSRSCWPKTAWSTRSWPLVCWSGPATA